MSIYINSPRPCSSYNCCEPTQNRFFRRVNIPVGFRVPAYYTPRVQYQAHYNGCYDARHYQTPVHYGHHNCHIVQTYPCQKITRGCGIDYGGCYNAGGCQS